MKVKKWTKHVFYPQVYIILQNLFSVALSYIKRQTYKSSLRLLLRYYFAYLTKFLIFCINYSLLVILHHYVHFIILRNFALAPPSLDPFFPFLIFVIILVQYEDWLEHYCNALLPLLEHFKFFNITHPLVHSLTLYTLTSSHMCLFFLPPKWLLKWY